MKKILLLTTFTLSLSLLQPAFANSEVERLMDSYLIAKSEVAPMADKDVKTAPFTIQVASYINEKDAASYVEELRVQEKEVYYFPAFVRGQVWYKVCVGKFATKRDADEYKRAFVKRMDEPFATVISLLDRPTATDGGEKAAVEVAPVKKTEQKNVVETVKDKTTASASVDTPVRIVPYMPATPMMKSTERKMASVEEPKTPDLADIYTLQVGAFPSEELAKNHMAQLPKAQNVTAFYQKAEVNGKTWYRLFVGRFAKRVEAEQFQKDYKSKLSGDSLVRKVQVLR